MVSASESVCMRTTHLSIHPPAGHTHLKIPQLHYIQNALKSSFPLKSSLFTFYFQGTPVQQFI